MIPFVVVGKLLQIARAGKADDKVVKMAEILKAVPAGGLKVLGLLKAHVRHVVSHEANNKMTLPNVTLVFAPNLLRQAEDPSIMDVPHQLAAMAVIFGDAPQIDAVIGLGTVRRTYGEAQPFGNPDAQGQLLKRHFSLDEAGAAWENGAPPQGKPPPGPAPGQSKLQSGRPSAESIMRASVYAKKPSAPTGASGSGPQHPLELLPMRPDAVAEFALHDADGDGRLTFAEVTELLRAYGCMAPTTTLREQFIAADVTVTDTLSFEQFAKAFGERGELAVAAATPAYSCAEAFAVLDHADSGRITTDELINLCRLSGGPDKMDSQTVRELLAELQLSQAEGLDYKALAKALNPVVSS